MNQITLARSSNGLCAIYIGGYKTADWVGDEIYFSFIENAKRLNIDINIKEMPNTNGAELPDTI